MVRPLTEKQEKFFVLFRQAIEGERAAQNLYAEMLANCEDPAFREIIKTLIDVEKEHEEALIAKYRILRQTGEFKD
jgi:rubrerythrin